jgi:CheY-like chemotaxis protein
MRVLLVDDNVDSSELLCELLQRAGHEVRVASDPEQALVQVPAFQPELAIIDIGLPIMDGYELAHEIRAIAHCGLIALSGYPVSTYAADARRSNFDRYLEKPLDRAALMQAIAALEEASSDVAIDA